jgi:hypothetical protein
MPTPQEIIARLQEQADQDDNEVHGGSFVKAKYIDFSKDPRKVLRFLPPKNGLASSDPWRQLWIHWLTTGEGREAVVCSRSYKNPFPCPFCAQEARLMSGNSEDVKAAGFIKAKQRVYAYAIDRADPEPVLGTIPSVHILDLAYWYFRDFRGLLIDNNAAVGMSPFNNEDGYDIVVKRTGEGTDTKYDFSLSQTMVPEGLMAKKSPLFRDPLVISALMEALPDISEYKSIEFSPDELQAILDKKTTHKALVKAYWASQKETQPVVENNGRSKR